MKPSKQYYDKASSLTITKLISGDFYITSQQNEMIVTILGSCISACIRDPILKVGGMNHFLLPTDNNEGKFDNNSAALRYGSYAMEILINELLKIGANKNLLEIKLFGGADLVQNINNIGAMNVAFIKEFVRKEHLIIVSEDLGGVSARKIHYYPYSGKAMVKTIVNKNYKKIIKQEKSYHSLIAAKLIEGSIELFN